MVTIKQNYCGKQLEMHFRGLSFKAANFVILPQTCFISAPVPPPPPSDRDNCIVETLLKCENTLQCPKDVWLTQFFSQTITTVIFALICVALTLFVISLDGTNWHKWSSLNGEKRHYDSLSGVDCETVTITGTTKGCVCSSSGTNASKNNTVKFSSKTAFSPPPQTGRDCQV